MADSLHIQELEQVVVRFSGDSGDGMQLAGNIFSTVSATVGNSISTFPDYPADIRAPQGSLTGVSGFQVHIGAGKVYTPGDLCDVLVAMNAAAFKTQLRYAKPNATIIIDTDAFGPKDLEKAEFKTTDYIAEMGVNPDRVIACPLTTMVKDALLAAPHSAPEGATDEKSSNRKALVSPSGDERGAIFIISTNSSNIHSVSVGPLQASGWNWALNQGKVLWRMPSLEPSFMFTNSGSQSSGKVDASTA